MLMLHPSNLNTTITKALGERIPLSRPIVETAYIFIAGLSFIESAGTSFRHSSKPSNVEWEWECNVWGLAAGVAVDIFSFLALHDARMTCNIYSVLRLNFHKDSISSFYVKLLTDRRTYKRRLLHSLLGIMLKVAFWSSGGYTGRHCRCKHV